MTSRLQALVLDDMRPWAVSRTLAGVLFLSPVLVVLPPLVLRMASPDSWRWAWREGGPAEWAQVVMLLGGVAFSLLIARRLIRTQPMYALLYLCLAAGLFFVAGEEIAWGQMVIGFDTPEELAAFNYKGELSVHNISSLVVAFNVAKLAVGAYGAFAIWSLPWLRRGRGLEHVDLLVPPLFLTSPFLVVIAARIGRWTVFRGDTPVGYGEFEELCLYLGMTIFTFLVWRRLRRKSLG